MSPLVVVLIISVYYLSLLGISIWTNKESTAETYFTGNHQSPWYIVAFGMIGVALSGVTFASLPGTVLTNKFYYIQFLCGNLLGYLFITYVLIPLYYKHKLISIYGYLKERFGQYTYKTGAGIFLVSQSIGASLRMLLAMIVLQQLFLDDLGISLWVATYIFLALIWIYTRKSGIKTLVWTDTLQTTFLIGTVIITVYSLQQQLPSDVIKDSIKNSGYFEFLNWDWRSGNFFFKQIVAGFFVAVAMMGLDQFMIQKTLTCPSLKDAQKNTLSFSLIVFVAQVLFLFLGFFLIVYCEYKGLPIPEKTDQLFSSIATGSHLGTLVGVTFLLGLSAATFSSADSSITALTTTFNYDFLGVENKSVQQLTKAKNITHIAFTIVVGLLVILFSGSGDDVFTTIFTVAGYTYGPLLALFCIGIYSDIKPRDQMVPLVCVIAPFITYGCQVILQKNYNFDLSFLNVLLNALVAGVLLCILSIGRK